MWLYRRIKICQFILETYVVIQKKQNIDSTEEAKYEFLLNENMLLYSWIKLCIYKEEENDVVLLTYDEHTIGKVEEQREIAKLNFKKWRGNKMIENLDQNEERGRSDFATYRRYWNQ